MLTPEPSRPAERDVGGAAALGVSGSGGALPYRDQIQRSFGGYDISQVSAHLDRHAAEGAAAMGAEAYATGNHVAFGKKGATLHTAAHEAAHVVQQRAGVSLAGGVGQAGDRYERHADAVADAVVRGESAEALLGEMAGGGGQGGESLAVQRRETDAESDPALSDTNDNASGDLALGAPAPLAPMSLDRARYEAWMALAGLDHVMTQRAFAHYAWLQSNLMKYASATGGATLPVGVGSDLVVKAAGAATTAVVVPSLGKLAVKALAPKYPNYLFKIYKLTAWAAGPLTTLLSFAWNIIDREFSKDRSHELSDAAGQQMASAMSAAVDVARGGMSSVLADWRVMSDGLKADLIAVEEAEVFTAITTTLNAQAKSIHLASCDLEKDLSLYADLIAKWLMQTAKDGESGGKDVNPVTYARTRADVLNKNWELSNEEARGDGRSKDGDRVNTPIDSIGKDVCPPREGPEHGHVAYEPARIFVEQCRYEWHNPGVDATQILAYLEWIADNHTFHGVPGVATGVYLFDRVKDGTAMMRYLAGHGLVRPVTDRPVGDPTPAGRSGSLYPEPPETTPHHGYNALMHGRPRKILEAVMHGEVAIECRLRVASANETRSAFVDGFSYSFKFLTPTGGEERARIDTAP